MALRRPGAYTPLAAHYADDEAIMAAGEDAELLYIRILAYCGRTPKTEGWISDKQIRTRIGLETRPEVGPETAPEKRAERCAEYGLLVRERDGYRVKSWLRWNRSAEEASRVQAQDRNRDKPLTSTDTGTRTGNKPGKRTGQGDVFQTAETETETDVVSRVRARQLPTDWQPNDQHHAFAVEHTLDLVAEVEQFRNHHLARGSTFKNWDAACRTWLGNAVKFRRDAPGGAQNGAQPDRPYRQEDDPEVNWMRPHTQPWALSKHEPG